MGLKVFKQSCKNCLFLKDRIVSKQRAKEIIDSCVKQQSHFICHKASINGESIICKSFYDLFGCYSQMIRIAERLNAIEFIDQKEMDIN